MDKGDYIIIAVVVSITVAGVLAAYFDDELYCLQNAVGSYENCMDYLASPEHLEIERQRAEHEAMVNNERYR